MAENFLSNSPFNKAVNLAERTIQFDHQIINSPQEYDQHVGQKRLARWKTHPPFTETGLFSDRLASVGLSEKQFEWHLGISQPNLGEETPVWQTNLETIWHKYSQDNQAIQLPHKLLEHFPEARFLESFQPFLQYACDTLWTEIATLRKTYNKVPLSKNIIQQEFLRNVPLQLIYTLSRTAVLELNVARLQNQLCGETGELRFNDFLDSLKRPAHLAKFLEEYPVLARIITVLTMQWVTNFKIFLRHLCQDWPKLLTRFGELGELTNINMGAGDQHHRGRTVCVVQFSSGSQLVYKPRSLGVDVHFQELLSWFNEKNISVPFRILNLLDGIDHGWVEFVSTHSCDREEQIKNFYRRQGAFLALLYALCANDFHYENLIAAGENPVLVDLETLFCPAPSFSATPLSTGARVLSESVFDVGMLPRRIWVDANGEGVDLSGMGMQEGQLSPHEVPVWKQAKTDGMHFARERMRIMGKSHQPLLKENPVPLIAYVDEICDGFMELYRLIMNHRLELLDFIQCFNEDRIRYVARPTRTYGLMLNDSVHPDLMRDALLRDQFFDKLWIGAVTNRSVRRLIQHEQEDLWAGDIPLFTTTPGSNDLRTTNGYCLQDYFDESGIERVTKRLLKLSLADMEQQLWLIRASLATVSRTTHKPTKRYFSGRTIANSKTITPDQLLAYASNAGERIRTLALNLENEPSWFGINFDIAGNFLTVNPIDNSFYNGLPGIALFFAYLGKYSENDVFTNLAKQLTRQLKDILQASLENDETFPLSLGTFDGWGGIVYVFTHLSILWNEPDLLADALRIAKLLPSVIAKDKNFDVISGSAGCIGALLSLYSVTSETSVLRVAQLCGNHLLANVTETEHGLAWMPHSTAKEIKVPLTGFSHGVAGIAWSLFKLTDATGDNQYADVAQKSLEYERAFYSQELQNWLDLSMLPTPDEVSTDIPRSASFWCHGASGIGLARLDTLRIFDNDRVRQDINAAIHTTIRDGFGHGHCLCHGDLGNIELLLQARSKLSSSWESDLEGLVMQIVQSFTEYGWLCGNALNVEEPGLMSGLAGIGYGLLRIAYPKDIPSVLLLEPPKLN